MIVKPDREPDIILFDVWYFYWDELVQYNPWEQKTYELIVIPQDEKIYFQSEVEGLMAYWDSNSNVSFGNKIYELYQEHIVNKELEQIISED